MTANILVDSFRDLWEGFVSRLPSIASGLLVLAIFYLLAVFVRFLAARSFRRFKLSEHASKVLSRAIFIAIFTAGVMVSLGVMGVNAGALVASLGLVSVGVGFALKDVIENFIAGVLLIVQRPFVVGDVVLIGDVEGTVEDVRVRDTVIRRYDGRQVFMPNAVIFREPVVNNTLNRLRRLEFEAGIAYEDDISTALRAASGALRGLEWVLGEPPPLVVVEGLGESSVVLRVYFWVNPVEANILEVQSAAIAAVKGALEEAGIEIPFPIVTVRPPG